MTDKPWPSIAFDVLCSRLLAGEAAAWELLGQRVRAWTRRFEPYQETAQDEITQNALAKIWQGLRTFDPDQGGGAREQNFWAWVRAIVRNEYVNYIRRESPQLAYDDIEQALGLCADDPRLTEAEQYMRRTEALEHLAERSWLRRLIDRLPDPTQRRVAFEHFIEGRTTNDIAKRTELPASTINNWIHRIPKKLRQLAREPRVLDRATRLFL